MKQTFFKTAITNLRLLLCLLALATVSVAYSQEEAQPKTKKAAMTKKPKSQKGYPAPQADAPPFVGSPILFLYALDVNYGIISQGSNPTRSIYITNDGDAPLIITGAKGSSSSISVDYPTTPIVKGQKVLLNIRYNTNIVGAFSKSVYLSTNASNETKTIPVYGEVKETIVQKTLTLNLSSIGMGECGNKGDFSHEGVAGRVDAYLIDRTTGEQIISMGQYRTIWFSETHSLVCPNFESEKYLESQEVTKGDVAYTQARGNVERNLNFTVNEKNYRNNQYELVISFNLGSPHKDNDFASTGYHFLTKVGEMIEKRIPLKGGYSTIGPYQTNSNRCHQYWLSFNWRLN